MVKHEHHIVPRHAGGSDDPSNIIELTIEDHAEAHRLLYEQYGRVEDLCAWKGLSGQWNRLQIFDYIKHRGPHSEATKQKISASKKGVLLTEDHKRKISESLTGRSQPESQKQKVASKLAMVWKVTDPEGNTMYITNLTKFARDRGLDQGNLVKVAKGVIKQSKGYRVEYCR